MRKYQFSFFTVLFILAFCTSSLLAQEDKPYNAGVLNGKAVGLPIPEYPVAAKAVEASGVVNVSVMLDESGNVLSAKAVSGHQLLQQAAENAARQAKFQPSIINGKAVRTTGIIVYNFVSMTSFSKNANAAEYTSSEVLNEKALSLPLPEYASAAKAVNASGTVNVSVLLDEAGNVTSAKAVSGHELLRQASETAARQAKFPPTILDGKAVKTSGIIMYRFVGNPEASKSGGLEEPTYKPQPEYSPAAQAVQASGTVQVLVTIDEKGNVIEARAISGHQLLRQASEKAAKEAKFSPFIINGEPAKNLTRVLTYEFPPKSK